MCGEALPGFGGYHVEVRDALGVTLLGLGLIGRNHFNGYGKGVHEKEQGKESVGEEDRDRENDGVRDGDRDEGGKESLNSTGEERDINSTSYNIISTSPSPDLAPNIPDLGSVSLQQSFSRELFRPPKGILLHGPSGGMSVYRTSHKCQM